MASEIRVNQIQNRTGVSTISFTESGPIFAGISTFQGPLTINESLTVNGVLTYEDVTNIDSVGIITANTGIHIDDSIAHLGDTDTAIRFPAADTFTVETAGTERLRITSDGSVGIGTNVPQATLHLLSSGGAATGNEGIRLQTTQATGGNWISFNDTARKGYFGYKETSDDGIYLVNEKNSHIVLGTNGVERLRITSDGYVTKPNNPAFIAGRTGGNQSFTLGTFPLNVTRLNVGNHYNTSTYKFVAPVAGVYYFYAQVYYNDGAHQGRIHFRKTPNGGTPFQLNTCSHQAPSSDSTGNMSLVESLAIGDSVELYSDQNTSVQCYYNINETSYGAHTYFMGYLIA